MAELLGRILGLAKLREVVFQRITAIGIPITPPATICNMLKGTSLAAAHPRERPKNSAKKYPDTISTPATTTATMLLFLLHLLAIQANNESFCAFYDECERGERMRIRLQHRISQIQRLLRSSDQWTESQALTKIMMSPKFRYPFVLV